MKIFEIETRIMADNISPKHIRTLGIPVSRIYVLVTFTMQYNLRPYYLTLLPMSFSIQNETNFSVISLIGMFQGTSEVPFRKVCQQMSKRFRTPSQITVKQ